MPIFRHFARETVRATVILFFLRDEARICLNLSDQGLAFPVPDFRILLARFELPAVVRERLIRLGHTMNVFLLFHRSASAISSIKQFSG